MGSAGGGWGVRAYSLSALTEWWEAMKAPDIIYLAISSFIWPALRRMISKSRGGGGLRQAMYTAEQAAEARERKRREALQGLRWGLNRVSRSLYR